MGALDDRPLLVVEVGGPEHLGVPDAFPAVVVAVSDQPHAVEGADVLLCEAGRPPAPWVAGPLAALEEAVSANPGAAVTLVQLLRLSAGRPVEAALVMESLAYSTLQGGPEFARWRAGRRPGRRPTPTGSPVTVMPLPGAQLGIHLDRPEVHNAYNAAMRDALHDALVAAIDAGLAVRISGTGPSFCSGGDLDEFGTSPDPVQAHLVRTARSPGRLLHRLADRATARIHGSCAGSGIELPAFAGTVEADPGTRIWLPEVSMGLIPGAGGTVSLPRRIGSARTAWLGLTGTVIDAATALDWGLVDAVVPVVG